MSRRHGIVALGLAALGGCRDPIEVRPPEGTESRVLLDLRNHDSLKGLGWKRYLKSESLHAAWVPPATDPWRPYYRPTLPAAIEIVARATGPACADPDPTEGQIGEILRRDLDNAAVFVDLPGEASVAWGARLAGKGFVPVLTVNNWPHPKGVVPLDRTLGALLYWAAEVEASRASRPLIPRPVFMFDNRRMQGSGSAETFDNRYFHVLSDLPPAAILQGRGILTAYYVHPAGSTGVCSDDLVDYFVTLKARGLQVLEVSVRGAGSEIAGWTPTPRSTVFSGASPATYATGSRAYGRSYSGYHRFWTRSQSTWGSGGSGGGSGFS